MTTPPKPDPTCPWCGYAITRSEIGAMLADPAAGGHAAAVAMSPEQRSARARRAGTASGAARRAARAAKARGPKA